MPRPSNKRKKHLKSAARARAGPRFHEPVRLPLSRQNDPIIVDSDSESSDGEIEEVCSWTGGVNNHLHDNADDWEDDLSADFEGMDILDELEGEELRHSLEAQMTQESESLGEDSIYRALMRSISTKEWKKAESHRGHGYNGQSDRTKRRREKEARDRESRDKEVRKSSVNSHPEAQYYQI